MQTITIGKKCNATFIPLDQHGVPNPVDASGNPLTLVGVPVWTVNTNGIVTLFPSPDGMNCDVVGVALGAVILKVEGDAGGGRMVSGTADVQVVAAPVEPARIESLQIQFGAETDV